MRPFNSFSTQAAALVAAGLMQLASLARAAEYCYLKASNTGANDYFGYSVSVSGDTAVVGAYGEASIASGVNGNQRDNTAPDTGAAYVFMRSGTNWSQQAYLKPSNPEWIETGTPQKLGYMYFGWSVAVSGDTVVVGARGESSSATGVNGDQTDTSAPGAGAAYVFVRSGTNWSQQAYLKASDTAANMQFGRSVAVSGDTVVVGAFDGAAYVFVRDGTDWSQQAYLRASNAEAGDYFGQSVSIAGDALVVGASGEASDATGVNGDQTDNSAPHAGAAYVFVRDGTDWSQQAYLKASDTSADAQFGWSVAVSGDTAVVGAPSTGDIGAAYVFVRAGNSWTQQAYLQTSAYFGFSVSISGDTLVVGTGGEEASSRTCATEPPGSSRLL